METKTDKAKRLFLSGKVKESMRIFKTFKIGFTKEEHKAVEISYEILSGHETFYRQLGMDTISLSQKGIEVICEKYNLKNS